MEQNVLSLSDAESVSCAQEGNVTRIELKANTSFTLLPRRSNDYRFKMTSGASEYFFKSPNVVQRDFWIKTLREASSSVCHNTCPRCCTRATRCWTDSGSSQSNERDASESVLGDDQSDEDTDSVFYVGLANPDEGITFANSPSEENVHPVTLSEGKNLPTCSSAG